LVAFTRDLRLHDHPALAAALERHRRIVPVFVLDRGILGGPWSSERRTRFLEDAVSDLDDSLRRVGAALVLRRGDWVKEVLALATATGAAAIHVSDDVTPYGRRRLERLERTAAHLRVEVTRHPGISIVPPGALAPAGGDHYRVFTPYYRVWRTVTWRSRIPAPRRITLPPDLEMGRRLEVGRSGRVGGASEAERRLRAWVRVGLAGFGDRDRLGDPGSSRLAADLHLGCLSPLHVAVTAADHGGADAFLRQLCWRDFFLQIVDARPASAWRAGRTRSATGRVADRRLSSWQEGRTGYPVVDAAMRQLNSEGYLPNRARMIVASFLAHDLRVDWRRGAGHFLRTLVDGDVAINNVNWQWLAGTDLPRSGFRPLSPLRQSLRFDAEGDYIRRYVPELSSLRDGAVHDPDPAIRHRTGYPLKIVERARRSP
jgi:deoxyribodipyrimidine photo-lyase